MARRRAVIRTLEHVLNEHRALSDLLVDDKLLIIGSDEKNHGDLYEERRVSGRGGGTGVKQPGARRVLEGFATWGRSDAPPHSRAT